jgi:hypothetical protein
MELELESRRIQNVSLIAGRLQMRQVTRKGFQYARRTQKMTSKIGALPPRTRRRYGRGGSGFDLRGAIDSL